MKIFGVGEPSQEIYYFQRVAIENHTELEWIDSVTKLKEELIYNEPAIVLIKDSTEYSSYELSRQLTLEFPATYPILCLTSEMVNVKQVMKSRAVEVIELPTNYEEISNTISEVIKDTDQTSVQTKHSQLNKGKVLTICSTKGGVGKTTLSCNLAIALVKKRLKVAILDLDLQFGDIGLFLDIEPKKTLYEWAKEANPSHDINKYMTKHSSGVDILSSPIRPEFSESINGDHILVAIEQLKKFYDWVIIDTPPSLLETDIVALEQSDEIFLITLMDLPTLKNSKLYLETLESIKLKKPVNVILNKKSKIKGIKPDLVERVLDRGFYTQIQNDEKSVITSINEGKPLVISSPRSTVSKSIYQLASQLDERLKKDKSLVKQ